MVYDLGTIYVEASGFGVISLGFFSSVVWGFSFVFLKLLSRCFLLIDLIVLDLGQKICRIAIQFLQKLICCSDKCSSSRSFPGELQSDGCQVTYAILSLLLEILLGECFCCLVLVPFFFLFFSLVLLFVSIFLFTPQGLLSYAGITCTCLSYFVFLC